MKRYIDAERLKYEIERQNLSNYYTTTECYEEALYEIIDSLEQEQPAKRGYKDCNGCEYNRLLKDQIGWQFRSCFGGDYKGKPIAEIELCPLKLEVQQEQPQVADASKMEQEVDLEKEYKEYVEDDPVFSRLTNRNVGLAIARHFWNKGYNARNKK